MVWLYDCGWFCVRLDVDGCQCWRQSRLSVGKMKTTVPGWNSGCRVVRNRCLVLLLLLHAARIQSFLWLHHLPKPDKISLQQTPVHSLEIVGQNHFITKKRYFKLTFQWDCEGLWWAKIRIHMRDHDSYNFPMIHAHPLCWGCMAQQG